MLGIKEHQEEVLFLSTVKIDFSFFLDDFLFVIP